METIVIALISLGIVFFGCMVLLAGAIGVIVYSRRQARTSAPTANPQLALEPELQPSPEVEVYAEPEVVFEAAPAVEFEAPAPLMEEVTEHERDTKPQPVLMADHVQDILDEEDEYALLYEEDVATSVRPEVRLPKRPTSTPSFDLPFTFTERSGSQTRVTRAADYSTADSGPLPMPVPPPGLEPIPELEPTQLMERQPEF